MEFRWNDWNKQHIAEHGMSVSEVERLIEGAKAPFPERIGEGKRYVAGKLDSGRFAQAIYVIDDDGVTAFVIHARLLNDREKRKFRRRTK